MPNIEPSASPLRNLWNRVASSFGPPAPSTPTAAESDVAYDNAVAHLPTPSIALPTVLAKMDPVGAKLDQLQATLKGPYQVNGETVFSAPQFRMNGGHNDSNAVANGARLSEVLTKAGLSAQLSSLQSGRATPAVLVKATQALIDAGELPSKSALPLATQIHDLQWKFGIGLDCAGYVYNAMAALHGKPASLGLKETTYENFTGLPQNGQFAKVSPTAARPGDVIVLQGGGPLDPVHNLIVRSHSTIERSLADQIGAFPKTDSASTIHIYEVDSSFSAGTTGISDGGVRRDVLMYDTASALWCTSKAMSPAAVSFGPVPYAEKAITGVFRAKGGQP
jgi:hypothetical protein